MQSGKEARVQNSEENGGTFPWLTQLIAYISSYLHDANSDAQHYPIKNNRFTMFGWNQNYQSCYTTDELKLLENIKSKYDAIADSNTRPNFFELAQDKRWFDWWICTKPVNEQALGSYERSFTLSNREAKDSNFYPLWSFADNMARQIANWQGERIKNQNIDLMNDPVMLALEEIKDWFFNVLAEKEGKKETLAYLSKRQSYIRNILHLIPNFGPDRLHLHTIYTRLEEAAKIVLNYVANKELPELLSDVIIKGKNLETTLGTYLHFLLINEEVTDNFSTDFVEGEVNNCHLSPVCKVFLNAQQDSSHVLDKTISKYQTVNHLYHLDTVSETNGVMQLKIKLKENLLKNIKFADFVSVEDKQKYLQAIAALESLMSIRKTLEQFKNTQSSLGTYNFSLNFNVKTEVLAKNYFDLIDEAQHLIEHLLQSANKGYEKILATSSHKNRRDFFENNLDALETRFALGTTPVKQLESYCTKAKESMKSYQDTMTKLVSKFNSGQASREVEQAMHNLIMKMNFINAFLPAQLGSSYFVIDENLQMKLVTEAASHVENNIVSPPDIKMELFDDAKWGEQVKYDASTKQPIYTYHVYKNGTEVGSAEFYGKPLLCFSEDKQRHNIIKITGALSKAQITEDMSLVEICEALPPSLFDKMIISARDAALYGSLRGGAIVLGVTLQANGISKQVAGVLNQLAYYGSIFTLNFYSYAQRAQQEDEISYHLNALYQAAIDTGQLMLVNLSFNMASKFLDSLSKGFEKNNYPLISKGLKKLSTVAGFGIFAYNATENGMAETSAALLSGTAAQIMTEKVGNYVVNKL